MQELSPEIKPLKLLITIVSKGTGKAVINTLSQMGLNFHIACRGNGTANGEILQYLNLSDTEKTVIFTTLCEDRVTFAMEELQKTFDFKKEGSGIAFTIPVKSIGGTAALKLLSSFIVS